MEGNASSTLDLSLRLPPSQRADREREEKGEREGDAGGERGWQGGGESFSIFNFPSKLFKIIFSSFSLSNRARLTFSKGTLLSG